MRYSDRTDAGRALAQLLTERIPTLRDERPIVLAVPRGGVPVGAEVARALGAPLDVFVARKLGAPGQEELGIGAVAPDGTRVIDRDIVDMLGVSDEYIEEVTVRERAELERRLRRFRGDRPWPALADRAVILVDDGLATGVTARASLAALREEHPSRLVFAAPVCSREGVMLLERDGFTAVCAMTPDNFQGVGVWYDDFTQTSDEEVDALLRGDG
ncbi:MAG: phosphoribosyltransferase [Gemmatimonadota bacterium]|nr:phosphoribosyltransferase [Gemmatimonadota bacterium]